MCYDKTYLEKIHLCFLSDEKHQNVLNKITQLLSTRRAAMVKEKKHLLRPLTVGITFSKSSLVNDSENPSDKID